MLSLHDGGRGQCPVSGKSALSQLNRPIAALVSLLLPRDLDPGWWGGLWMSLRLTLATTLT
jgi:hypothetical protein